MALLLHCHLIRSLILHTVAILFLFSTSGYNPFPFYYPAANILNQTAVCMGLGCTTPVVAGNKILFFEDTPADPCLPDGNPALQVQYCPIIPSVGSFVGFKTSLVGINSDGTASAPLYSWTWKSTFDGTSGGIPTTFNPFPADPSSGTGGVTVTSINDVPQQPPSVTCVATPNALWPPNGKSVVVTVSGTIAPGTQPLNHTAYGVIDEYGQVQPSGSITLAAAGNYSFGVPLVAARNFPGIRTHP